jgi:hypothetical protein
MRELTFAVYLLTLAASATGCVVAWLRRERIRAWLAAPWVDAARDLAASNNKLSAAYDNLAAALRERNQPR